MNGDDIKTADMVIGIIEAMTADQREVLFMKMALHFKTSPLVAALWSSEAAWLKPGPLTNAVYAGQGFPPDPGAWRGQARLLWQRLTGCNMAVFGSEVRKMLKTMGVIHE